MARLQHSHRSRKLAQHTPAKQELGLRKPRNTHPSIQTKNAPQPKNNKKGKPNMNIQKRFTKFSSVNKSGNHTNS